VEIAGGVIDGAFRLQETRERVSARMDGISTPGDGGAAAARPSEAWPLRTKPSAGASARSHDASGRRCMASS